MKESFQERLKLAMFEKGFKSQDLVQLTGISKARISQYINGVYEPKSKPTYLIAKALDVDERWLMGYDVPMREETKQSQKENIELSLDDDEAQLLDYYRVLNSKGKEKLLETAQDMSMLEHYKKTTDSNIPKLA